ncbi:GNAT family N-acetyltransferase [Streptomyces formicae]|uniref:Enhanced intracellular survival protein n=1 Tax=Streptomyces formicae TaxID=1616117 RepID=A0A291QB56_9ACTN|nr:GNAT family N-acetyltransferase [Streptomyces formicae]ATL28798.1 Enhanced intracellular survival protein [Streptomyces formicae]
MSDVDVRAVADAELPAWLRAVQTGFLQSFAAMSDQAVANLKDRAAPTRVWGAFDGDRVVGTFRSFDQRVTAVGGAPVAANAVTAVTVAPTHRRRGILSRMMATDLAAAKERGDVVATLISAEYPIYGRYGFGPATWVTEWSVDVLRSGLDPRWSGPAVPGARIDLVDGDDVRKFGPELHERVRAERHGVIDRGDEWWLRNTGQQVTPEFPWQEPFYALYRDPSGRVDGLAAYRTSNDEWGGSRLPLNTATVLALTAATTAAERDLWHYLCAIDKVITVKSGWRAPDDLLPHLLPDLRAATVTGHADWLWLRILDVVRALESRTYAAPGSLVLEITDGAGLAGGRYRLDATPQGATCVPTTESADLALDVAELAELWLGDASAARLVALGRIGEEGVGAAALADVMFRTSRRPWCPDLF